MRFVTRAVYSCSFLFSLWAGLIHAAYCGVGQTVWAVVPGYTARVPAVVVKVLSGTQLQVAWEYALDFCVRDASNCVVSVDEVWDRFGTRCESADLEEEEQPITNTTASPTPTPPPAQVPAEDKESGLNLSAILPAVVLFGLAGLLWLCISRRRRAAVSPALVKLEQHIKTMRASPNDLTTLPESSI